MTRLQRRFEQWAALNRWSEFLPLGKDEFGAYTYPITIIAYQAWMASQADVIDLIGQQSYPEEQEAA